MKSTLQQPIERKPRLRDDRGLFEDGLATMVGVASRLRSSTFILEKERPDLAPQLRLAREATGRFIAGLTTLVTEETAPYDVSVAVNLTVDLVARYGDDLFSLSDLPLDQAPPVSLPPAFSISLAGPVLFQTGAAPSTIDLETLIRVIDSLIIFLERIVRSWTEKPGGERAAAAAGTFIAALRTYRAQLAARLAQGAGQRVAVREVLRVLRPILFGLMSRVGNVLTRAELRALGARLATWVRGLAPLAGAGGAEAGAVSVALLHGIVLCIIAAYVGYWLGRVIGNTRVGDLTVDEHLADYFSSLYDAYVGECQVPLGQFIDNHAARRGVEALDDPPAALIRFYLQAEIEDLDRLIEKDCDGRSGFWQRLRDQRAARLAELGDD